MNAVSKLEPYEPTEIEVESATLELEARLAGGGKYGYEDPGSYFIASVVNQIENEIANRDGLFYGSKLLTGPLHRIGDLLWDSNHAMNLATLLCNREKLREAEKELREVMEIHKQRARSLQKKAAIEKLQHRQLLTFRAGELVLDRVTPALTKLQDHFEYISSFSKLGWYHTSRRGFSLIQLMPELRAARDCAFMRPSIEALAEYRNIAGELSSNLRVRDAFEATTFTNLEDWKSYLERANELLDEFDVATLIESVSS